jgi:heme/copper-type cytochrome/quinol oxidase subunit 1
LVVILKCNYDWSLFVEAGPPLWMDYLPSLSALPQAIPGSGYGLMVGFMAILFASSLMGSLNHTKLNLRKKNVNDKMPLGLFKCLFTCMDN